MNHPFTLDKFQQEAIEYTRDNKSVIVCAPTGAGKTLIAEDVIEECLKNKKGIIYTAPIKALSNQKFRDFSKKYPEYTGILTGDVNINRHAPILIMTTEIFRNAILVDPYFFKNREWVIFDEIHYLDDAERGTVWEEAIILLPQHMKMLALSATIPNVDAFSHWLRKVHAFEVKTIIEKTRPVPLHFLFQCDNTFYPNLKELKKTGFFPEAAKTTGKHKKIITTKANRLGSLINHLKDTRALSCVYFSFSRRRCEELAQEAAGFILLGREERDRITLLFNRLVEKFNINASSHTNFLYPLIKNGIAYHHAGLLPALKEIIERLFTTGLIKLIFTTETFALGVNMPARTVVFDALAKFYRNGKHFLKTRDFYQMAGRAGRRGIDKEGFVLSRLNPNKIDLASLEKIIYGEYEPVCSQLNSCYATILNLYKTMGRKIFDIYPESFHFHEAKNWEKEQALGLLKRKISLLRGLEYIKGEEITRKAQLAARVYSFELHIGELFQCDFLAALSEQNLFSVIMALVYEPRKGQMRPRLRKQTKKFKYRLEALTKTIHKEERKFKVSPLTKPFYFHLDQAARAWFDGIEFQKLSQCCPVDEGEIVRYFRMGIQVLREMQTCPIITPEFRKRIQSCQKRVQRDVVDAESQLKQEI